MAESRLAALESWFVRLPSSKREVVVTVKDGNCASILRNMLKLNSLAPSSSLRVFYFVEALQRRRLSEFGSWIVGRGADKSQNTLHSGISPRGTSHRAYRHPGALSPPKNRLAVQDCPSHLARSKRVLDASWELDKQIQLDFTDTISVPWHGLSDARGARQLFKCLITLARPEDGENRAEAAAASVSAGLEGGTCKYFTPASFAASVLLTRIVAAFLAAHTPPPPDTSHTHRARCNASSSSSSSSSSSELEVVESGALVVRLAGLLRGCACERERARWEVAGAKQLLIRKQAAPAAPAAARAGAGGWGRAGQWARKWSGGAGWTDLDALEGDDAAMLAEAAGHVLCEAAIRDEEAQRLAVKGWSRPCVRSLEPWGALRLRDREDCLELLLELGAGYGPLASRFKLARGAVHVLLAVASAPLAHAAMHAALWRAAWQPGDAQMLYDAVAAQAKPPPPRQKSRNPSARADYTASGRGAEAAAMAMGAAKGPVGLGLGLELSSEAEALIAGHDQEWTQLGRIEDVQRHADAELRGLAFHTPPAMPSPPRSRAAEAARSGTQGREGGGAKHGKAPFVAEGACGMERPYKESRTQHEDACTNEEEDETKDMSLGESSGGEEASLDWVEEDESWDGESELGSVSTPKAAATCSLDTTVPHCNRDAASGTPKREEARRVEEKGAPCGPCSALQVALGDEEAADERAEVSTSPALPCSGAQGASAALGFPLGTAPAALGEEGAGEHPSEGAEGRGCGSEGSCESTGPSTRPSSPPPPPSVREWQLDPLAPQFPCFAAMTDARRATARRLHAEVEAFVSRVEPEERARRDRDRIVQGVAGAVAACWAGASVEVYGSFATGLYLPHSDVDLVVMGAEAAAGKSALQVLADRMRGLRWCRHMNAIETATVPVIKLQADAALLDPDAASRDGSAEGGKGGRCIAVDVTLYSDREHLQSLGVSYSPIECRDFAVAELRAVPVLRPLVLTLKQLLFRHQLNDSYSGGLSSHALLLLLIFFFRLVRSCQHVPGDCLPGEALMAAMDGDVPADCRYGEWLLRALQWLSEFPFDSVGLAVSREVPGIAFLGRTEDGLAMLTRQLPLSRVPLASRRPTDILHLEDPFNQDVNVAKNSYAWWQVCRVFNAGWLLLNAHHPPAPHLRIFGGVPEVQSPLNALLSLDHAAAPVAGGPWGTAEEGGAGGDGGGAGGGGRKAKRSKGVV